MVPSSHFPNASVSYIAIPLSMDTGESSSRLTPQRGVPRGRCGRRRRETSPLTLPQRDPSITAESRRRRRLANTCRG